MSSASSADLAVPGHPAGHVLVVGLGNPILGDDGVGWLIAEALRARMSAGGGPPVSIEVDQLAVGGLSLMERIVGHERVVLVDAMVTGAHPPGTVCSFSIEDIPGREATHLDSAHDASLATALAAGVALGAAMPAHITIIAVEALRVSDFCEVLTPAVEAAIPVALDAVLAAIARSGPQPAAA